MSETFPNPADRRDSPRVPMKFLVRDLAEGGSFDEVDGDLSVGGAMVKSRHPPQSGEFELRFHLPGQHKDIRCKAELLRVREEPDGTKGYQLRFLDLDVNTELAIAKYLDDLFGPANDTGSTGT